jgi:putative membrane protein
MRASKLVVGLGIAMMASSVATAQSDTRQGSGIRVRKDVALTVRDTLTGRDTTIGVTTPAPSYTGSDMTTFNGWGDGHMIHYVIVGDSMEVEIARLAETRAASAEVREFARMLITDHSAALAEDVEMAKDEDLGRTPHPNDHSFSHLTNVWNDLRGLSGSAFDRAFLQRVAMKHQSTIAAYRTLEPSARDDDLEKLLEDRLPVLERHLSRAREIAGTIGVNVGM